jgi:hypothetical protein
MRCNVGELHSLNMREKKSRFRVCKEASGVRLPPRACSQPGPPRLEGSGVVEGLVARNQGLTLVHFPAQRKRILWDTLGA